MDESTAVLETHQQFCSDFYVSNLHVRWAITERNKLFKKIA
jgi:hypothetical protein